MGDGFVTGDIQRLLCNAFVTQFEEHLEQPLIALFQQSGQADGGGDIG